VPVQVAAVTRGGRLVWEFHNIYDERSNGIVNSALAFEEGYFEPGVLHCP
jgi:hypothetical protein